MTDDSSNVVKFPARENDFYAVVDYILAQLKVAEIEGLVKKQDRLEGLISILVHAAISHKVSGLKPQGKSHERLIEELAVTLINITAITYLKAKQLGAKHLSKKDFMLMSSNIYNDWKKRLKGEK